MNKEKIKQIEFIKIDYLNSSLINKKEKNILYNAINKTKYANIDDLTLVTLKDALYISMKTKTKILD